MSLQNIIAPGQITRDIAETLNLQNYAFVEPENAKGIGGFVFDVNDREEVELSSDITDHYTESNSYINDHVTIKPMRLRLSGFIGELVFKAPDQKYKTLRNISNKLTTVDAYLGQYTAGLSSKIAGAVSQTERALDAINNAVGQAQNFANFLVGEEGVFLSKQKNAFYNFKSLKDSRQLVSVVLPWGFFQSMMIESIRFSQSGDTQFWSEISVTLKEMRFAQVQTTNFDENLFPPRSDMQSAGEQDAGVTQGQDTGEDVSALYSAFGSALQ